MMRLIYRRNATIGHRGRIDPPTQTKHNRQEHVFLKYDNQQRSVRDIRDATIFGRKATDVDEKVWSVVDLDVVESDDE